ncbi:MAG: FAD-dependent oxidoreductase [Acidobacteriota bacterium]
MTHHDVAIVGSGFAGSILARALNRRGRRVLLLERGQHPRFALGESTTPLANLALERLAASYDLPDLRHLSSHGRWLRHLPQLRRGLKRGFTFFHHRRGVPYRNSARNEARLLVAASPDDEIADTHWLRHDVDHHLVRRAVAEGVDYRDHTLVEGVEISDRGVRLAARCRGQRQRFNAEVVVDGSGPAGFLAHCLGIAEHHDRIPFASGLLSAHFDRVHPLADLVDLEPGPYPDERAAVHHLLDIGWLYALPFDHGPVSAGLVLRHEADLPNPMLQDDPATAWRSLLGAYPSLAQQFADARPITELRWTPRLQHRLDRAAGERWFLLPHAYAFYDPMFSTGMAWSLLAAERLALLLTDGPGDPQQYEVLLAAEADRIEHLIETAYLTLDDFDRFVAVTLLYFATVSFAETTQRLLDPPEGDLPHAWQPFLAAAEAHSTLFRDARDRLRRDRTTLPGTRDPATRSTSAAPMDFHRWARRRIAPFDVAGFGDADRQNLYPVDLDVLVDRAPLLGLTRDRLRARLPRLRGQIG